MSAEEIFHDMERSEGRLARAIKRIVKQFLNRIPREKLRTIALGDMYGWWADEVDEDVLRVVREIWLAGYSQHTVGTSLDGLESYMARVTDRLVRGIHPPLPEAAFNQVRIAIVLSAANGWSSERTAQDIAARLSWEKDGAYWRSFKTEADEQIDKILDPLGEPGSPSRDWAQQNDPRIHELRHQRNEATRHLDAEQSYWHTRAITISRSESTAAYNAGALSALHSEGFAYKEWLATKDTRTRETHRIADGQVVELRSPFQVGVARLQMPGDPTGAPEETVNCRCAVLGSDGP